MTKREWLKQNHIHVLNPKFDLESEADAGWIHEWEIILDRKFEMSAEEQKNADNTNNL